MSTATETTTKRERTILYVVSVVLLVAFLVGGLIAFHSATSTREAEEKADQLIAALEQQGARTPTREQIITVLGDDGGAVCANPNEALNRAILFGQLTNGAAGPGMRPVIADNKVVQGQLLIIQVYCPEELDEFQKLVDDLNLNDEVAGE
jgi:hypothetical protein